MFYDTLSIDSANVRVAFKPDFFPPVLSAPIKALLTLTLLRQKAPRLAARRLHFFPPLLGKFKPTAGRGSVKLSDYHFLSIH